MIERLCRCCEGHLRTKQAPRNGKEFAFYWPLGISYRASVGAMRTLLKIRATNFLSLRRVRVELQDLNVLVGPNGAGKTNLLSTIKFIGAVAELDLIPAIESLGGFRRLAYAGIPTGRIAVGIEAKITDHSSANAPDSYTLSFVQRPQRRRESD